MNIGSENELFSQRNAIIMNDAIGVDFAIETIGDSRASNILDTEQR